MGNTFFLSGDKLLRGKLIKPLLIDRTYVRGYLVESNDRLYNVSRGLIVEPGLVAMFPSDLQWTVLEDIWVDDYDATLDENQDRYMHDFFMWCERNCISKAYTEDGHTIFRLTGIIG